MSEDKNPEKKRKINVSIIEKNTIFPFLTPKIKTDEITEKELKDDLDKYMDKKHVMEDSNNNVEKYQRKRSQTIDLGSIKKDVDKNYDKKIKERCKNDVYFKNLRFDEQIRLLKCEEDISKYNFSDIPLRYRILQSARLSIESKQFLLNKINMYEKLIPEDNEYSKMTKYIESLKKLPFDNFIDFPISKNNKIEEIRIFMENCTNILNKTIYGQKNAKERILELIAQRISNPSSVCSVIALTGPAGVGKTSLVKNGVSKALQYPFAFTALGGATDSSFLEGHGYTYEGSHYGRIAEMLIETQCMNPILFFDELDKISDTAKGGEITGILTHITDTTQNMNFYDKYFMGMNIDLSKCIIFFSLNDINLVNPILKDRLTIVEFDKYGVEDKVEISKKYVIKEICKNIGINEEDYIFEDEFIKYMIEKCSKNEDGIRNLKRGFEKLLMKVNYEIYMPKEKCIIEINEKPYKFKKSDIDKIFKEDKKESIINMLYI